MSRAKTQGLYLKLKASEMYCRLNKHVFIHPKQIVIEYQMCTWQCSKHLVGQHNKQCQGSQGAFPPLKIKNIQCGVKGVPMKTPHLRH